MDTAITTNDTAITTNDTAITTNDTAITTNDTAITTNDTAITTNDIDEGATIFSFPFKTEGCYDYQYRFIDDSGAYLIQIVKTMEDESDLAMDFGVELIQTILTINKNEINTTIQTLINKNKNKNKNTNNDDGIFLEFLLEIKRLYF